MSTLIYLPLPPSMNQYYMKGRFISSAGKEYRSRVITAVKSQNRQFKANVLIEVNIVVNFPTGGHQKDLDNYANTKGLFDALTHAEVWEDDKLVKRYSVEEGYPSKDGSVIVEVNKYEL